MAAPTVAAVASGNGTANYTVNVPAGTTNGDLLIAIAASDWGTFAGNDVPAAFKTGTGGITLGTSDYDGGSNAYHIALGARIASSEPANYTFPVGSSADHVAAIIRVTGHDPTPVIAQVAPSTTGSGTTAPSIVPNGSDDLLITIHGSETTSGGARTWTPPSGMSEHVDRQSTTFTFLGVNSLQNPSNPSGTKVATASGGVNKGAACTISIKAASGGGSVNLVIQDALHATSADSPSITQVHSLAVQDARHTTVADSPGITQNHILVIQETRHLTSVDSPSFTQNHVLAIQDARHATSVDNVDITQSHQLSIQEALHASVAENLNVTQNHLLIIQDTVHTTQADNLDLSGSVTLAIQKAIHATKADNVGITQLHEIVIHDSIIQMTSDHVILFGPPGGGPMSVSDLQAQKLPALSGITGSVPDMLFAYYGGLSGLTPITQFSVSDHRKAYYVAQTGLPGSTNSMADLEEAFYDAQLVPAGSLADREFAYWFGL